VPAERKVALVADIKKDIERAEVVIGTDHSQLDVEEFQALRRALRPADVKVRVVKNSLAALAAKEAGKPEVAEILKGPTTLTFGFGDPVAPARQLMAHLEGARLELPIHGGWLDGNVLNASEIAELAKIPSKEELLAGIIGKLRSPISNLHSLLSTTMRDFSGLIEARATQIAEEETTEVEVAEATEAEEETTEVEVAEATEAEEETTEVEVAEATEAEEEKS